MGRGMSEIRIRESERARRCPMESCLGGEDALAQVLWGVGVGRLEPSLESSRQARVAQCQQNLFPGGLLAPQEPQTATTGAAPRPQTSFGWGCRPGTGDISCRDPPGLEGVRMSKPRLASWLGEVKDGTGQLDGPGRKRAFRVPEWAEREHRLALPVRGRLPGCGSAQGLVAACPAAGDGRRVCGERPMWPRAPLANDGDPFEAESEPTRLTASSRWGFEPVLRNLPAGRPAAGPPASGPSGTGHPGWRQRLSRMTQD